MISERHEQLIHDVLAGDASPAQRAELEQFVAADPEIRARYGAVSGVFRLLSAAHEPGVPGDLHGGIMRAIAAEPPTAPGCIARCGTCCRCSGRLRVEPSRRC